MDTTAILIKAYELADAICRSELFQTYKAYQQKVERDDEVQTLLQEFKKKQDAFEEMSRFGTYHPDYVRVKKEYQKAKIALMNHPTFNRYKRLEKEFETTLYHIEESLQAVIGISNRHKKSALKYLFSDE